MRSVRESAIALGVGAVVLGCSGGSSDTPTPAPMTCGPGTVGVGGQCQSIPADSSVGGNGGAGGTVSQGGSGGNSGNGGTVSQGGNGGTVSQGGWGGEGGTGGVAGNDAGDAADTSVEDVAADVISDVHQEGDPWPGDDPCPTVSMGINQSDSCAPGKHVVNDKPCQYVAHIYSVSDELPFVFRTPSKPGMSCGTSCMSGNVAASYMVSIEDDPNWSYSDMIRVTVQAPWSLAEFENDMSQCWPGTTTCSILWPLATAKWVVIHTSDPDAPARNVLFEKVPHTGTCP